MSETQTALLKEPFIPKKMMTNTAAFYKELTGDSSIDAAKHAITHLLPRITADAIIHDNGCGTGEVTKAIWNPIPESILIQATDRNQYMIDGCREFATAGNWPVEATV
ncbi:uncharacterized protein EAF02_000906 [Botrytis sinoallii]|uniref:uncharacterized protein n=1 Tax=Botrytis sinoallii TaxID=1463999 RepID=UPI0019000F91|nr:uncharacterized protein EAF02_000906 [Botrytis sinoallii]KAF7893368.1 hypothetical protein EAF02_000906 [Botrytis sinoallii]